jgi:hypothetical protein
MYKLRKIKKEFICQHVMGEWGYATRGFTVQRLHFAHGNNFYQGAMIVLPSGGSMPNAWLIFWTACSE